MFKELKNKNIEAITYFNFDSFDKKQLELNENYKKIKTYYQPFIFKKENGLIIKVSNIQYDYVVDGVLISQRGVASEKLLDQFIKEKIKPLDYTRKMQL